MENNEKLRILIGIFPVITIGLLMTLNLFSNKMEPLTFLLSGIAVAIIGTIWISYWTSPNRDKKRLNEERKDKL